MDHPGQTFRPFKKFEHFGAMSGMFGLDNSPWPKRVAGTFHPKYKIQVGRTGLDGAQLQIVTITFELHIFSNKDTFKIKTHLEYQNILGVIQG